MECSPAVKYLQSFFCRCSSLLLGEDESESVDERTRDGQEISVFR